MVGNSNNFANREIANCVFVDYKTKQPVLYCDYANTLTKELTGESVFAYGGQGHPRRISFSGERGGTITIETQIQSFKLWQIMTGGDVSKTAKFIKREVLTAEGGSITLSTTPATDSAVNVFAADDDCGTPLEVETSGTAVTLPESSEGDFVAYYVYDITEKVQRLSIKGSSMPKNFTLYGDTVMKSENDELLPYRFIAYKCACQPNMSISCANTGDPATITLTADLLSDSDGNMLDMILEEEEE